jgi:hypothetical protein
MTRDDALKLLDSEVDISYMVLDDIFRAFGFSSTSPDFETEAYRHDRYPCGIFTARDTGYRVLSPTQRIVVQQMVTCVLDAEARARDQPPGRH